MARVKVKSVTFHQRPVPKKKSHCTDPNTDQNPETDRDPYRIRKTWPERADPGSVTIPDPVSTQKKKKQHHNTDPDSVQTRI